MVGWIGLGGGGGGGYWLFLLLLFVVVQHWFHAIHSKVRVEPWARTPETQASDFARDYTACFYCRQVSVFTTSDLVEIAWMLQK